MTKPPARASAAGRASAPRSFDAQTGIAQLADGRPVRIRPLRPSDRQLLADGMERLTDRSRRMRFLGERRAFSPAELDYLCQADQSNHIALLAFVMEAGAWRGAAVARAIRLETEREAAEAAVTVLDAYQDRGLGTLLLRRLATDCRTRGIRRLVLLHATENLAMSRLVARFGGTVAREGSGVRTAEIELD